MPSINHEIIQVVRAVQLVEGAQKRRDFPTRPGVTFFSIQDMWLYHGVTDTKICPVCRAFELEYEFRGNHLRATFPYLELIDENTVKANVHPNCRCYLRRYLGDPAKYHIKTRVGGR